MPTNTYTYWAGPSAAGAIGVWGPWYGTDGIINIGPGNVSVSFDISNLSEIPSGVNVEVRYFNGQAMVSEIHNINGDGSVTVNVGEGASTVYVRAMSILNAQILEIESDIGITPGLSPNGFDQEKQSLWDN